MRCLIQDKNYCCYILFHDILLNNCYRKESLSGRRLVKVLLRETSLQAPQRSLPAKLIYTLNIMLINGFVS